MTRTALAAALLLMAVPAAAQEQQSLPALRPPAVEQPAEAQAQLSYTQVVAPDGVRQVQAKLHDAGAFDGAVDGRWGADSDAALRSFQQTRGLQVTGQMNQATAAVLGLTPAQLVAAGAAAAGAAPPASRPAAPAASHQPVPLNADAIRAVQAKLQEAGFYNGPVDGVWGPGSEEALVRLQEARGLDVTRRIDAPSVQALGFDPDRFP